MSDFIEDGRWRREPDDAGQPVEGEALAFSTTLEPRRFLGLSLKNGLLNLVTLTLYRFWGKTEVRRRVWSGVRLNDEAFEYTGRGVELFVGFVLAVLFLGAPALLILFGAQFFGPWVIFLAYLPMYVFLGWLWGFGTYTAFRYMASRTTWRGVRFQVEGSAAEYGLHFLLVNVLSGLTLGWYWPTAERQLAEKIWDNVRFGDRRVRFRMFAAEKQGVYGAYAIGWCLTPLLYILVVGLLFASIGLSGSFQPSADGTAPEPGIGFIVGFYVVLLVSAPLFLLAWAPYQAAMLRSVTAGVGIDDARFSLEVDAIPLWWLTMTNLLLLLITFGFLMPWVQARTARFLIQRLRSTGFARLDLAQQAGRGPGSGEGLADAFGFSAI